MVAIPAGRVRAGRNGRRHSASPDRCRCRDGGCPRRRLRSPWRFAGHRAPPCAVKGVGFDATCSLVVLDRAGNPLTVSMSGDPERNVIVWMDHRATAEARAISETGDEVLRFVGGVICPETQTPKLL